MSKRRESLPPLTAELYDAAEVALDDADNFYSNWLDAGRQQLALFENHLDTIRVGMDAVAKKMMALTARNLSSTSQFAHKLMHARDASEISHLHLEFYQKQAEALAAELQDLGETVIKTAERAS